ncbi:MAG: 2Fe-2S iron-sulfur cluster-binding protein [Verrucomicrobiota bacterium]|nr:2Fe-2S iron-sulfur cluster-binding protein [Verrucomicrobiota bacterium]MDQ3545139.1 2Fe-2S iron-sulfur cluster-binding protein [Verrucomicrobiota bacterium]
MSDDLDPAAPGSDANSPSDPLDEILIFGSVETRRRFLKKVAGTGAALTFGPSLLSFSSLSAANVAAAPTSSNTMVDTQLKINGAVHKLRLDPRTTLLDLLRENLQLTGSKKGCDHGQCGACTVLINGRRINSCLALAVTLEGDEITTIEGLAQGGQLHPMQAAFLEQDGFQCGYCTPGQICSAVACVQEGHAGDDAQIREFMSGNLCRCGAYPNIVEAIKEARGKMGGVGS